MNALLALADHGPDEATELEASAERKFAEARAETARAAVIRALYAAAAQLQPTRTEGETR